jgi:hypothetical protein
LFFATTTRYEEQAEHCLKKKIIPDLRHSNKDTKQATKSSGVMTTEKEETRKYLQGICLVSTAMNLFHALQISTKGLNAKK